MARLKWTTLTLLWRSILGLRKKKDRRRGKVFIWETAKYGKIWYDEDVHDLRSVETKFPAIVLNDSLTSNETPSCEPTVSSLNDEIDFRISLNKSDDEDYTDKDEGKSHAGTLIDIPVFVGRFSIISGFTIIDDDDMTKDVVVGMKFCKKYASCQMIMKKFTLGDKCEQVMEDE
ncbi:hypothetical protein Tco_0278385 [Tanacetum coccineum]